MLIREKNKESIDLTNAHSMNLIEYAHQIIQLR